MKIIILFAGNIIFNALGNVLMKRGTNSMQTLDIKSVERIWNNIILNPSLVSGILCYGFSLIFYIFVLQKVNLSVAYPIVISCTAVLVNVASRFIFHEAISMNQILGYVVVIFGIYLIVK